MSINYFDFINVYFMGPARLIEPGVSYFLEESLKKCHEEKWKYNNLIMNGFLLMIMIVVIWFTLYHLQNSKNITEKEKREKDRLKQTYFLDKIKQMSEKANREFNLSITNLPKFETPFEILHKNFYST